MWRNYQATTLATPEAFKRDPGLVWLFYSYRRHMALQAQPNSGHFALAELARRKGEGFWCLTQNIDGLSQRAHHPPSSLKLLHGSLFTIKCADQTCNYTDQSNFSDPIAPCLTITSPDPSSDTRLAASSNSMSARIAYMDPNKSTTSIPISELPHCPSCQTGLLRPGVVWFGEPLPEDTLDEIDEWIFKDKIDIVLVIGTTATVYPAASYVNVARAQGARVVVVNMDVEDLGATGSLGARDFLFQGDAAELLPKLFENVIGDISELGVETGSS
ncbi:hypothetical protein B7494_g2358 [Chlorociboria aeruginascens]|nr:hypothetical protein B7494_g2358 [Chlorociboria aeruginascens]